MWDFSIQTDHVTVAWRPDLVIVDKRRTCKLDFAVTGDCRVKGKEKGKIEKYQDIRRKLQRLEMWESILYH